MTIENTAASAPAPEKREFIQHIVRVWSFLVPGAPASRSRSSLRPSSATLRTRAPQ